jgi:NAD-dependent SIR2 family protein deacetylase
MNYSEFLRIFNLRASNLAWFLGAGASAAAGIPTAGDLIWEFKRTLYCSSEHVSRKTLEDLSNQLIRLKLQSFFDTVGSYPQENAPEEYAAYFEATYPDARDRRTYLDNFIRGVRPAYGHLALAALMRMRRARALWTSNFDRLIEDAAVEVLGSTSHLAVATLETSDLAMQAINEGRWPFLGKLHGDFQSRRLKNTPEELRVQDAQLRYALSECCKRFGLNVVGYSGRDDSIMDALEEAAATGGYPGGLFWFQRPSVLVFQRVQRLIERARANGIQAEILEVPTFDELMGDIFRQLEDVPVEISAIVNKTGRHVTDNTPPEPGRAWPIIRLNALPILESPSLCRRIECEIGGYRECQAAVKDAPVLVTRRDIGVLAFGSDSDLRRCFDPFKIRGFDLHSIEFGRLRYDSAEHGLLSTAIGKGFERIRPLVYQHSKRSHMLRIDPQRAADPLLEPLRRRAKSLTGTVPETSLIWIEAVKFRLESRGKKLWLLLQPFVWVEAATDDENSRFAAANFVRERMALRYNAQYYGFLSGWIEVIIGNGPTCVIQALGISNGVDAEFRIAKKTAFTARSVR